MAVSAPHPTTPSSALLLLYPLHLGLRPLPHPPAPPPFSWSCRDGVLSGPLSVGPHSVLVPMPHTLYHHFSPPPPKNPQQDLVSQKPSGGQEKLREFPEVRQLVGAEDGARVVGAHPSPAHMMSKAPSWGQSLRHLPTHPTPFPTGTCPVSTSPVIPLAKLILWKYRRLTDVSFLCTGNAMRFLSVNSDFSHSCHPLPFLLTG